jgi:hypothetical protein
MMILSSKSIDFVMEKGPIAYVLFTTSLQLRLESHMEI